MLRISEQFLIQLFKFQTKVLMGKILKRVEIFKSKEDLLTSLREIIPEWTREQIYHIKTFNNGIESFEFELKNPTKMTD